MAKSSFDTIPVSCAVDEVLQIVPDNNEETKKKRGRPKKVESNTKTNNDPVDCVSNENLEKDITTKKYNLRSNKSQK